MSYSQKLLLALAASPFLPSYALTIERRDGTPNLPYDDKTTKDCTWWIDYNGSPECTQMLKDNWTNLEDFRRWNPTIGPGCAGLTSGKSYCVEVLFEAPPGATSQTPTPPATSIPTSTAQISSTSVKSMVSSAAPTLISVVSSSPLPTLKPSSTSPKPTPIPSSTKPTGNGIETPLPTQPGMVSNCDKFYFVTADEHCDDIASRFGLTLAKFLAWNPQAGDTCAGLWAKAYACVSIIGEEADTTTSKSTSNIPTTTKVGNGVETPQPTQPGMVTNCAKFHWIAKGVVCSQVLSYQKITLADFVKWNPTVGSDCTGMQANVNVCVGVIGGTTPTPTPTTSAGNGIQTPQPTQSGMVSNCKKFHYAETGVVCSQITSFNNISLADFIKWNPGVGPDCKTMMAKTYTCVGVL